MTTKIVNSWMFPEYETDLMKFIGSNGENNFIGLKDIKRSLTYIRKFDLALDVGANIGLVSVPLSKSFKKVMSFECVPETFECLVYNTQSKTNVECIKSAVSNSIGSVDVAIPKRKGVKVSSGWASIEKKRIDIFEDYELIKTDTITIDHLNLTDCDFLKIDVEQAEMMVIEGAIETILKFKPVIQFENKRKENDNVILKLISLGYVDTKNPKLDEIIMIHKDTK